MNAKRIIYIIVYGVCWLYLPKITLYAMELDGKPEQFSLEDYLLLHKMKRFFSEKADYYAQNNDHKKAQHMGTCATTSQELITQLDNLQKRQLIIFTIPKKEPHAVIQAAPNKAATTHNNDIPTQQAEQQPTHTVEKQIYNKTPPKRLGKNTEKKYLEAVCMLQRTLAKKTFRQFIEDVRNGKRSGYSKTITSLLQKAGLLTLKHNAIYCNFITMLKEHTIIPGIDEE